MYADEKGRFPHPMTSARVCVPHDPYSEATGPVSVPVCSLYLAGYCYGVGGPQLIMQRQEVGGTF